MNNIFKVIPEAKIRKLYSSENFEAAKTSVLYLLQKCIKNSKGDLPLAVYEYTGINAVKLMMTYRSKGAEFDTVFFADFKRKS